ncbi:MAG: PKD domain-containing protein [Saprospiraceae bacterium]
MKNTTSTCWALLVLFGLLGCGRPEDNPSGPCDTPPTADFDLSTYQGTAPCTVSFSNLSVGTDLVYSWELGDGDTFTGATPSSKTYAEGTYVVRLIAQTADQCADTLERTLIVVAPGLPPIACFSITPVSGLVAPVAVAVNASCSQHAQSYSWDFDDPDSGTDNTANGPSASHTFAQKGTYTVALTITGTGGTATTKQTVIVQSSNFSSSIDINGPDITPPLFGVETPDGRYHVLFRQNGTFKSVLISAAKQVQSVQSYSLPELDEVFQIIPSGSGGFVIVGTNTGGTAPAAVLVEIGNDQTVRMQKAVPFEAGAATTEEGRALTLDTEGNYRATGLSRLSGSDKIGFSKIAPTGAVTPGFLPPPAAIGNAYGIGIAQLSGGDFTFLANQTTASPAYTYLVRCDNSGALVATKQVAPIGVFTQIVSLGEATFALEEGKTIKKYGADLSETGSYSLEHPWNSKTQLIRTADNNLLLSQTNNGRILLYKLDQALNRLWPADKLFSETGTITSHSAIQTADGGYLITALYTSPKNLKRLYLIRTDANGNQP